MKLDPKTKINKLNKKNTIPGKLPVHVLPCLHELNDGSPDGNGTLLAYYENKTNCRRLSSKRPKVSRSLFQNVLWKNDGSMFTVHK